MAQKKTATDTFSFGQTEGATPLIRQYQHIKTQHPDHILFFRCGDFYEMFFEDAKTAARVLGITLTSRGTDANGQPIPLAGVPYHSVEPYLARMIRAGHRVAICEQMENPKHAKGVVKREVVRVVTPGTVLEENLLDNKTNNYLAGLIAQDDAFGLASLDFSTGQFAIAEFHGPAAAAACANELARLSPSEIIVPRDQRDHLTEIFRLENRPKNIGLIAPNSGSNDVQPKHGEQSNHQPPKNAARIQTAESGAQRPFTIVTVDSASISPYSARAALLRQLGARDLSGFGAEETPLAVCAAGAVLEYLRETQRAPMAHLNELSVYHPGDYMTLDATTQRSLELAANLTDATRRNTLLEALDHTATSMGGRLLRSWLLQPLRDHARVNERLDAVEIFTRDYSLRSKMTETLRAISDLERIVSRAACKTANARDLVALRNSLQKTPVLRELLLNSSADGAAPPPSETSPNPEAKPRRSLLAQLRAQINPLEDLTESLACAIADAAPMTVREGGMIKTGFDARLDELRALAADSKSWIASMRQQEIERTGIASLKIGFNKVFGYYIEIPKSQAGKAPPAYFRKQTLVNAERFITEELKEKEDIILHAEERAQELEFEIFEQMRESVCAHARDIQNSARAIARVDALLSLAQAAIAGNYCRPSFPDQQQPGASESAADKSGPAGEILIIDGRHPVIEAIAGDQPFVPNDARLDNRENQILIITGPNMAGKSTYIRQVALITLMAHVGSFVPAREARICLVDRIFTRVGAMDQLARGQSTFLVEMSETANILNNATDKSLVILDEIGRGTSTYDGLSIAWAVIEYLHNTKGRRPKTLFATHYHELADLEGILPRVKNYNVAVLEEADRVAFLYKIVRGSTDRSYGIYAAQVAGLPRPAIERAKRILADLEEGNAVQVAAAKHAPSPRQPREQERLVQLTLFDALENPVLDELRALDPNKLTPIDALSILARLAAEARKP
ncbi:MAG: DNA mismatch repair protein MutS [Candidatus Sumerlaeota bacterium]|nr:DNA mismatch repair protein MutS [Candidatus Sumerlaeota bacterium]